MKMTTKPMSISWSQNESLRSVLAAYKVRMLLARGAGGKK